MPVSATLALGQVVFDPLQISSQQRNYSEAKFQVYLERLREVTRSANFTLQIGDYVSIKNHTRSSKLDLQWIGMFRIIQDCGNGSYMVCDAFRPTITRKVNRRQMKLLLHPSDTESEDLAPSVLNLTIILIIQIFRRTGRSPLQWGDVRLHSVGLASPHLNSPRLSSSRLASSCPSSSRLVMSCLVSPSSCPSSSRPRLEPSPCLAHIAFQNYQPRQ